MASTDTKSSRAIFDAAVYQNHVLGHENRGFLSPRRGFLPVENPLLALPDHYQLWDELTAELPLHFRNLTVRRAIDALPVLAADPDTLPESYLLRASSVISILAHSYVRSEVTVPNDIPQSLLHPWETISHRLERPAPFLSYIDLILYNWRVRNPEYPNDLTLANLDLLIPTVGNEEERIFYLTQVQIHAAFTPILNAILNAQDAVRNEDEASLERELIVMIDGFSQITAGILSQIDPNPNSASYVDQVVWAKTVAPFAVPIIPGRPGPSGTASPIFHLMDAFLNRPRYDAVLGHEASKLAELSPRHWREFIDAVRQISIRDFILKQGSNHLKGLFDTLLEAYAGDKGYLGAHRLKAYGFLEIAFKAGRSVTIGGFKGLFRDKTWNQIDHELQVTRGERYLGLPQHYYTARPAQGHVINPDSEQWTAMISLDLKGKGVRYRPGDRVGILPENSSGLIQQTLKALQARGSELITLTPQWQHAIAWRHEVEGFSSSLPLIDLLRFGKIRPVSKEAAQLLYRITMSDRLHTILESGTHEQWELWELLELLRTSGFDTSRLWKAAAWEPESICHVVVPETYRLYSIASELNTDEMIRIVVAGLQYESQADGNLNKRQSEGTTSAYLRRSIELGAANLPPPALSLRVVPAPRFHLPDDPSTPIVMFAGGSGIAPFLGFVQARLRQLEASENWLFYGIRTIKDMVVSPELRQLMTQGRLQLRVALSRQEQPLVYQDDKWAAGAWQHGRIDSFMEREAEQLWKLIEGNREGQPHAQFYICGRTHFAETVIRALQSIIRSHSADASEAAQYFYRLVAERRLLLDVFTTYSPPSTASDQLFDASEVVLHNNDEAGYWMVLNRKVYDLTEFVNLHSGGKRILANNAGIDATQAYRAVLHHIQPEVDALLGLYEIGMVRRLQFAFRWAVGIGPEGLFFFILEEAFTAWVRALYLLTEMENAIRSDFDYLSRLTTRGESPEMPTALKIHLTAEAHKRFLVTFLDGWLGEEAQVLWSITTALFDPSRKIHELKAAIERVHQSVEGQLVRQISTVIQHLIDKDDGAALMDSTALNALMQCCYTIRAANLVCFTDFKMVVRAGVQLFERPQGNIAEQTDDELISVILQIPTVLQRYYSHLAAQVKVVFLIAGNQPELVRSIHATQPIDQHLVGHGTPIEISEIGQDSTRHNDLDFTHG